MLDPQRIEDIRAKCRLAPCIESLRLELLDFDWGSCRIRAPQDPAFNGVLPGFHGGMLAMVADCAAWFAIVSATGPEEPLVTTDLDMRYLKPCNGDCVVEAKAIKIGRTLCPVQIDMFDPAGEKVAVGCVTYIRLSAIGAVTAGGGSADAAPPSPR